MKKIILTALSLLFFSSAFATYEQAIEAINNPDTGFVCTNVRLLTLRNEPLTQYNAIMVITENLGLEDMDIRVSRYLEETVLWRAKVKRKMDSFDAELVKEMNMLLYGKEYIPGQWLEEENISINNYPAGDFAKLANDEYPNHETFDGKRGFRFTLYTGEGSVQVIKKTLTFDAAIEFVDKDGKYRGVRLECGTPYAYEREQQYGDVFGNGKYFQ